MIRAPSGRAFLTFLLLLAVACNARCASGPEIVPRLPGPSLTEELRPLADRLPPGHLHEDPEIDRDLRGAVAFMTASLDDKALWPEASSTETYRLAVHPSKCPYLIRLDLPAEGPAMLTLRGGGRYIPDRCTDREMVPDGNECVLGEAGPLLIDRAIALDRTEAARLSESLRASNPWSDATLDPVCDRRDVDVFCEGGTNLFLEIRSSGRFHFIHRWTQPERNRATAAMDVLLEAAAFDSAELDMLAAERGLECAM